MPPHAAPQDGTTLLPKSPIRDESDPCNRRAVLRLGTAAALGLVAGCAVRAPAGSGADPSASGATPTASGATPPASGGTTSASGRLRLIGETTLPHRLTFNGTTVGGLSGLDFDPARELWYALSDDRSDLQPARFYTLRLNLGAQGLPTPELLDVVTLRQPDGTPFPRRQRVADGARPPGDVVVDPESIRWRADTGTLLWTSEGDARLGQPPFIREMRPDGTHLRELSLPPMLRFDLAGQIGPRDNLTLEGLALTPDGRSAWAAMEGPLVQDGPVPAVGQPAGPCRITRWDLASGRAVQQFAYRPDAIPVPSVPAGAAADNGISEILMLDAHRMLVLERAYMTGVGNSLRLYQMDTRGAADTLALASLAPGAATVPKRLVADFGTLGLSRLDNTEGMAWGPPRANGARTLVVVSDDNFNPRQVTQFAAFEFTE